MSYGPPQIVPPLPINEPGALGSIAQPTLVPGTGLEQFESPQPIADVAPTPDPVPPDAYRVPGGDAVVVSPALTPIFPGLPNVTIEPYPQPPPGPPTLPIPTVSSISPSLGDASGGIAVTITGTNFTVGAIVRIGNIPATNVVVVSPIEITATTPAIADSEVPIAVSVSTLGGTSTLAGAYTSFWPTLIPGLEQWLRADLGVTLAIGTSVSGWADQSGAGDPNRNLTQAIPQRQPTLVTSDPLYNNRATLNFLTTFAVNHLDMVGLWSNAPIAQPYTIVVVGNDGNAGTMIFIGELLANNWYVVATSGFYGASVGATFLGTTPDSTTPKVLMLEYNDPNSTIRVSEETVEATGNIGAGNLPQLEVSAANGGVDGLNPGKVAELVIVQGILSSTLRTQLMTYFNGRYAIAIGP